jgi:hypothetical protein
LSMASPDELCVAGQSVQTPSWCIVHESAQQHSSAASGAFVPSADALSGRVSIIGTVHNRRGWYVAAACGAQPPAERLACLWRANVASVQGSTRRRAHCGRALVQLPQVFVFDKHGSNELRWYGQSDVITGS